MGSAMPLPDLSALPGSLSPSELAARCRALPGLVFFDSADADGAAGRWSMVAACPSEVIRGVGDTAWAALEAALALRRGASPTESKGSDGIPGGGFAAGWVEYEGAICFGLYEGLLAYRHADDVASPEEGRWVCLGDLQAVAPLLEAAATSPGGLLPPPRPAFCPQLDRDAYMEAVLRAQSSIAAGDIYQVNITHPFFAAWEPEWCPYDFYERLRAISPAPYAAYLSLEGRSVLSSSPELFLKIDGREATTRPIKGTRPRGSTEQEDIAQERELTASLKESAELVMITDLERNDLGQVCEYGSVRVSELLKLERYRHVFHLVSTVQGRLRGEVTPVAALRACFPGGSITGAPKKRAREIIAELERTPRGLYTGAIGYFGFDGQTQFNIAIRTAVVEGGRAHFHVGAGIVADSSPAAEWEETLHKARGLLLAAGA